MLRRIPPSPVTTFGLIVVLIVLAPRANALLLPRLARDPGPVDSCTRMQAMLLGVQIWGIKPVTFSDRHLICQIQITCDIESFVFRHRARSKQQKKYLAHISMRQGCIIQTIGTGPEQIQSVFLRILWWSCILSCMHLTRLMQLTITICCLIKYWFTQQYNIFREAHPKRIQ